MELGAQSASTRWYVRHGHIKCKVTCGLLLYVNAGQVTPRTLQKLTSTRIGVGQPTEVGIRGWAGLKGHIDDRNLACSLASEGRRESPRGRLGAAQTGTMLSFFS